MISILFAPPFLIELMTMLPIRIIVLPVEVLSLHHIAGAKLHKQWEAFEGIFGAHSTAFELSRPLLLCKNNDQISPYMQVLMHLFPLLNNP